MKHLALIAVLAACGKVEGFGGPVPPLARFPIQATGTIPGSPNLQVAFVWGRQWLVEPLCIVPIDPRDNAQQVAAVVQAGCRDPFGYVPARVAASVPVELGVPSEIDLYTLPAADVMVGDLTARVAYGNFVLYDDKDGDGTLDLAAPNRPPDMGGGGMGGQLPTQTLDVVWGASFVAMTRPDQRAGYREGVFVPSGFYPRAGCGDPPPGFSVLAASGFTVADAITATQNGTLPQETDLSQCQETAPEDAVVTIPVGNPADRDIAEQKCTERITDSTVRYREPPASEPDLTNRVSACVHYPSFGTPSDVIEWVLSGRSDDSCVGLTHYILKGCREGPDCGTPDWNDAPPPWWPCPQ